jgi:hypothetical protein
MDAPLSLLRADPRKGRISSQVPRAADPLFLASLRQYLPEVAASGSLEQPLERPSDENTSSHNA